MTCGLALAGPGLTLVRPAALTLAKLVDLATRVEAGLAMRLLVPLPQDTGAVVPERAVAGALVVR